MVVGNEGKAFRGSAAGGWVALEIAGMTDNFWGLCVYQGVAYCTTNDAIYRLMPDGLVPMKIGGRGPKDFYRLFSNAKFMWLTTGTDRIFRFDGKWKELVAVPYDDARGRWRGRCCAGRAA